MALGQALLDRMELLDAELQLQSGEVDVTRGLLALNVAQDYFESLAAARGRVLGSKAGTLTTTAATETTTFPSGVLRIDKLYLQDSNGRIKWQIKPRKAPGGHVGGTSWPVVALAGTSSGEPAYYQTNGTLIYWNPTPSGVSTVRWYGFQTASDITAAGTFAYPDVVMFPLATFAVKVLKSGLDDDMAQLQQISRETFEPVLDAMERFDRDGAVPLAYTTHHSS
jgi:hypothetical protein